jgi:hypothetical protein
MRTNIIIIFSALLIVLGGLIFNPPTISPSNTTLIESELNSSIILYYNQSVKIKSEDLYITFLNVKEDSRCPLGVLCEWPGQVTVILKINKGGANDNKNNLTIGPYDNKSWKIIDGYNISLQRVQPYPFYNYEIKEKDYKITISVNK